MKGEVGKERSRKAREGGRRKEEKIGRKEGRGEGKWEGGRRKKEEIGRKEGRKEGKLEGIRKRQNMERKKKENECKKKIGKGGQY